MCLAVDKAGAAVSIDSQRAKRSLAHIDGFQQRSGLRSRIRPAEAHLAELAPEYAAFQFGAVEPVRAGELSRVEQESSKTARPQLAYGPVRVLVKLQRR